MSQQSPTLLFAALRRSNLSGIKVLVLVDPKTGKCFEEPEESLREDPHNICLGEFVELILNENTSNVYSKTAIPNVWKVQIEKDVAFVYNVKSILTTEKEKQVFRSECFADSVFQGKLKEGKYSVRLRLFSMPYRLSPESIVHFEATNAVFISQNRKNHQIPRLHSPLSPLSSWSSTDLPQVPKRRESKDCAHFSPVRFLSIENLNTEAFQNQDLEQFSKISIQKPVKKKRKNAGNLKKSPEQEREENEENQQSPPKIYRRRLPAELFG